MFKDGQLDKDLSLGEKIKKDVVQVFYYIAFRLFGYLFV